MKDRMIEYYMDVARRTSQLSYAEKLKVGAILVKDDMIVSHSWNGTPRGTDNVCEYKIYLDQEDDWVNQTYDYWEVSKTGKSRSYRLKTKPEVTHAEEAMLMKVASTHQSTVGGILFCTHSCCMNCAKLIYGAKIKEFYYSEEYRSDDGIKFLQSLGIPVYKV